MSSAWPRFAANVAAFVVMLVAPAIASADPPAILSGGGVPVSLQPPAGYTPSQSEPMTHEQFMEAIKPYSSMDWSSGPFGSSGQAGTTSSVTSVPAGVLQQLPNGSVSINADAVGPGTSILGVQHAQTLVYGQTTAAKVINGTNYLASCVYEIFAGTPQATRNIKYGMAWNCNQPWLQGYMAPGLGDPLTVTPLDPPHDTPIYDSSWYADRTYVVQAPYTRTSETQLEAIWGYLVLHIDGGTRPNDGFLTNPGAAGAYSSYQCSAAMQVQVTCEIITDPFTFVPTDNTQCNSGDACGPAAGASAYAGTLPGAVIGATSPELPTDSPTDLAYADTADPVANATAITATAASTGFDHSNRYQKFCWGAFIKPHGHCPGPTHTWQYVQAQSGGNATPVCARMYYPAAAKNVERLCGSSPVLVRWDASTGTARRLPPSCNDRPDQGYGGLNTYCYVQPFVGNASGSSSAYIYGDGKY